VSNSLAVAMVTAALRRVLGEVLVAVPDGGVENARVTTLRPDMLSAADGDARGINIFLYQVATNAALAGHMLPVRRADGSLVNRPEQALDLYYLLTFSGNENALEPQRMLGAAMTGLVAEPVLGRQKLRDIIAADARADQGTWEKFSDLPDQPELVRFSLLPLSLQELYNLWSTFFQTPYRLSVAYQASVVLLDADLMVRPALPVLTRGVEAAALSIPVVSRVIADSGPVDPIVPGSVIRIEGERLRGADLTRIRLDDTETPAPAAGVTGTRITMPLPTATPAGLHSLQVRHPRLIGTPPAERAGAESAVVPLLVRPVVGAVTTAAGAAGAVQVAVRVQPPVGRSQRVVLLLNERQPPAGRAGRAYAFTAPLPAANAPATADRVTVAATGVAPGTYLVRLQVDGAQSVLTAGPDGRFDAPRVVFP
jgi:Pvc16 N-terminal domain